MVLHIYRASVSPCGSAVSASGTENPPTAATSAASMVSTSIRRETIDNGDGTTAAAGKDDKDIWKWKKKIEFLEQRFEKLSQSMIQSNNQAEEQFLSVSFITIITIDITITTTITTTITITFTAATTITVPILRPDATALNEILTGDNDGPKGAEVGDNDRRRHTAHWLRDNSRQNTLRRATLSVSNASKPRQSWSLNWERGGTHDGDGDRAKPIAKMMTVMVMGRTGDDEGW